MVAALTRGLTLSDFEVLTVGMIIGFITKFNNMHDDNTDKTREANQSDFNSF